MHAAVAECGKHREIGVIPPHPRGERSQGSGENGQPAAGPGEHRHENQEHRIDNRREKGEVPLLNLGKLLQAVTCSVRAEEGNADDGRLA